MAIQNILIKDPSGNIHVHRQASTDMTTRLEPGEYEIKFNGENFFIRERSTEVNPTSDVTQTALDRSNMIYSAFLSRKGESTGAILHGIHGGGKTLISELITINAIKDEIPVIHVNEYVIGDFMRDVISTVGRCVLVFDEIDRTHGPSQLNKLTSFFSDSSIKDTLFILTTNNVEKLPAVFNDRPGRFLFKMAFDGCTLEDLSVLTFSPRYEKVQWASGINDFLGIYTSVVRPSYDVLKAVMDIAVHSSSVENLQQSLIEYNVPALLNDEVINLVVNSKEKHSNITYGLSSFPDFDQSLIEHDLHPDLNLGLYEGRELITALGSVGQQLTLVLTLNFETNDFEGDDDYSIDFDINFEVTKSFDFNNLTLTSDGLFYELKLSVGELAPTGRGLSISVNDCDFPSEPELGESDRSVLIKRACFKYLKTLRESTDDLTIRFKLAEGASYFDPKKEADPRPTFNVKENYISSWKSQVDKAFKR